MRVRARDGAADVDMTLFANPCPVCGATDEHAAWAGDGHSFHGATFCPHPREPGHGTGCCCAGRSRPWTAGLPAELLTAPAGAPSLVERVATLEATVQLFARKLLERGDITINDARATAGLPALEARFAPVHVSYLSMPPLTEAEEAEVMESAAEALKLGPAPPRPAPEPPALSPAQVRYLLRECVTVVKPRETLVVRGTNWTPAQTREIQQVMDEMYELGIVPFKALAVFGDELGVAEAHGGA